MTPPIGGSNGMDAIGAMLARGQGAPASAGGSMQPAGAPPSPGAPGAAAAGMDAAQQQNMQMIEGIRNLGEAAKQLALTSPLIADEAQQIQQLLKQMVVKVASTAPVQTASSQAVPMGMTA